MSVPLQSDGSDDPLNVRDTPLAPDLQQGMVIFVSDSYRFSDDELILECRVRCHPPPKITWLKDGVPLQGSTRHQQSELADGVCRLIISSPDCPADSGQYTCVAENNVWSDQISSAVQFTGNKELWVQVCPPVQSDRHFVSLRTELTALTLLDCPQVSGYSA